MRSALPEQKAASQGEIFHCLSGSAGKKSNADNREESVSRTKNDDNSAAAGGKKLLHK
jgi:hypothetical protein